MPVIRLPTAIVHYRDTGTGHPLLLLHANPGDSRDFDAVIPTLAEDYRVIAPDWPGYGLSTFKQPPEELVATDYRPILKAFIEALDLADLSLVGNSLGGNAAAWYAAEHPERVRSLVLVSPGGFTPHNWVTRAFCRWQGGRFAMPPGWFARVYLRKRTPVTRVMLGRASGEQSAPDALRINRAVWRSFADPAHDLRPLAGRIRCPTLLMFGQGDPVIPARVDGRIARLAMPEAVYREMPCGHAPFAEMPERFMAEVSEFLVKHITVQVGRMPPGHPEGQRIADIRSVAECPSRSPRG